MKNLFMFLLLSVVFINVYAAPEDYDSLRVDRDGLSWVPPTTDTHGNPLPLIDRNVAYCSNTPGVNAANTTLTFDMPGDASSFPYAGTFADGQWHCRITTIVNSLPIPESGYSNETNFIVVGGIAPYLAPRPPTQLE